MLKLTHFRLCPHSRSVRLVLGELQLEAELVEERPWEWRAQFLALNPAGSLPVLERRPGGLVLCGAYAISEFLADEVTRHPIDGRSVPLFPGTNEDRAEVRRLVDWFHVKCHAEVTSELAVERINPALEAKSGRPPSVETLRAVRSNLRYHLSYIDYLADSRRWLAGEELSFADFAAAAHISVADYLGEVPWDEHASAKTWYARLKSRRSFRPLLADRLPGLPPPLAYTDLDF